MPSVDTAKIREMTDNLQAFLDGVDKDKPWVYRADEIAKHLALLIRMLRDVEQWPSPDPRCPDRVSADVPGQTLIPGSEEADDVPPGNA